jgi:hypothetical protein
MFPGQNDRRPLLATFTERANFGTGRAFTVLAFHPSPARAVEALSKLASVLDQHCQPVGNQVTVAAGDMNINLIQNDALEASVFYRFETNTWQAQPYTRVAPNPPASTIVRRSAGEGQLATPADYKKPECLDYGWVRYGNTAAHPAGAPAAAVVDRVAGAVAAPPFPQFTSELAAPLSVYLNPGHPYTDFTNAMFRWRWNYGHISPPTPGTSDHLPVLLVV